MAAAHDYDAQSTYRVAEDQFRPTAALVREIADGLKILAKQASDEQPVGQGLIGDIQAAANEAAQLATEAESWYPSWRALHTRDIERVENPRTGEVGADAGTYIREN